ncbi:MAG: hypothetical protein ACLSVD_04470 [Eggerthellaceae bacterium]
MSFWISPAHGPAPPVKNCSRLRPREQDDIPVGEEEQLQDHMRGALAGGYELGAAQFQRVRWPMPAAHHDQPAERSGNGQVDPATRPAGCIESTEKSMTKPKRKNGW